MTPIDEPQPTPQLCNGCGGPIDEDRGVYRCETCDLTWIAPGQAPDEPLVDALAISQANTITLLDTISALTGIPAAELSPMGSLMRFQLLQWKTALERDAAIEAVEQACGVLCKICKAGVSTSVVGNRVMHYGKQVCRAGDIRQEFRHMEGMAPRSKKK